MDSINSFELWMNYSRPINSIETIALYVVSDFVLFLVHWFCCFIILIIWYLPKYLGNPASQSLQVLIRISTLFSFMTPIYKFKNCTKLHIIKEWNFNYYWIICKLTNYHYYAWMTSAHQVKCNHSTELATEYFPHN